MNNITPETLSTLPEVDPATESGVFAWGYDRDNPSKLVRFPASGGGGGGLQPASLICETRPSDPSTYLLTSPANNLIAFNTATGSNPSVYDQSSGVFTLPADGVYALSVAMIIDSIDELAFAYAGVTLLVNSTATYSFPDGVLSPPPYPRAVVIGTVMFEGQVGNEIQLNVYLVDSGSNAGGNLINVSYSNYISLFKL